MILLHLPVCLCRTWPAGQSLSGAFAISLLGNLFTSSDDDDDSVVVCSNHDASVVVLLTLWKFWRCVVVRFASGLLVEVVEVDHCWSGVVDFVIWSGGMKWIESSAATRLVVGFLVEVCCRRTPKLLGGWLSPNTMLSLASAAAAAIRTTSTAARMLVTNAAHRKKVV